jgi:hypothetical protein
MAINQIPSLRTWVDGQAFSARDYVYERNVIVDKVNELVLEVNELSTAFDVNASLGDNILDARYYTETELLSNGVLDARYYREGEIDGLLSPINTSIQTLESRVNQDVRNSASPTFVQITLGAETITATKIEDYDDHIASTANPHQVSKGQVGLGDVTDDKQVKAAASSTDGRVPKWSGTSGDAIVDGFDVKTTITDSNTDLPTGKAVKDALDLKLDASKINFIESGPETGKIDASSLPSYVDDVIEVATFAELPATGESGKIYYVTATNITYRWTGSSYVNLIGTAAQTSVDTSAFNGELDPADNTVQKALDRLDNHTHDYTEITNTPAVLTAQTTLFDEPGFSGFLDTEPATTNVQDALILLDTHDHVVADITDLDASTVTYNNTNQNLDATDVQAAITELDGLIEEGLTQVVVVKYTITDADNGTGGFEYNRNDETGITGTKDNGKFVFTLPSSIEYVTGGNRLSVKIDGDNGALKRLFYGADDELTEPTDSTFAIDYALVDDDVLYAKIYQSLATVTLNIAAGAVTESKLASDAVTTTKIEDSNVTLAKLQDIATLTVLGNDTGDTANVKALTATEAKTLLALENVNNTADSTKPVSQAQQIEFDKTNNTTYYHIPSNPQNSDLVLTLTNGLKANTIITIKVPASLANESVQARLSINNGAAFSDIYTSALTQYFGSNIKGKNIRLHYDSSNNRFIILDEETDPVFAASAAAGIDSSDITNWNTAYGWGDHADEGYLTSLPAIALDSLSDVDVTGVEDGQALVYDDATSTWIPGEGGGGASVTVSTTAPAEAEIGDLWYDSTSGALFIYYDDGDSTQWVEVTYEQDYAEVGFFDTTIAAADTWTDQTGFFTLQKTVSGITATDKPVVDLDLSAATVAEVADIQAAWATIYRVVTGTDTVTFYALEDPTFPEDTDISIQVVK